MRTLSVVLVACMLCLSVGCGTTPAGGGSATVTPEQMKDLANKAGYAAAMTFLAIQKPTVEDATKIKIVVDFVGKTVSDWPEGGFLSALPALNLLIDKEVPVEKNKALNLLCKSLGQTLLSELDNLFNKHPEWKKKGSEVAGIVGAFDDGASAAFAAYIKA
jgi:hypothetical protein